MDLGIKRKTAFVAAASEGLGKASAFALAQEGANLVICSRDKKHIEMTADEIRKATGADVRPVVCDVSKLEDVQRAVAFTKETFGTIHILVNNAGGPPAGDFLSLEDNAWQKAHDLTLMSAVRLAREVLPMMIKQKWGRIVTIVSVAAKQPINELILSSAVRPGILGLTKVLSNKYAANNVTVNTVCPGYILTNRQKELMEYRSKEKGISQEEYLANAAKEIPAGRLGEPREIGEVVAFLASERASYINGANLLVDGGAAKGIH